MKGIGLASALGLLLGLFSSVAQAEFGTPYVTPAQPVTDDMLFVNVPIYQIEYCEGIVNVGDYPLITRDGNAITILFNAVRFLSLELCPFTPGIATQSFGIYPPGSYTLTVQLRYPDVGGDWVIETLDILPFMVGAPPNPVAVPIWDRSYAIACILLLLFMGSLALRRRGMVWLCVLAAIAPVTGQATEPADRMIEVLLTTAPGAPTAEQLVEFYAHPTDVPPLDALHASPPVTVDYLLPVRTQGQFREDLLAEPQSVRAQLERYVLMVFSDGVDIDRMTAALQADPFVRYAGRPLGADFSSATVTSFTLDDPEAPQYGRDDLNIDAAWTLAGGYALIAQLDSGLYVKSPRTGSVLGNRRVSRRKFRDRRIQGHQFDWACRQRR